MFMLGQFFQTSLLYICSSPQQYVLQHHFFFSFYKTEKILEMVLGITHACQPVIVFFNKTKFFTQKIRQNNELRLQKILPTKRRERLFATHWYKKLTQKILYV